MIFRALLIEDNSADAILIREMLNRADGATFDISHVERLARGLAQFNEQMFDVVLLDLSLPDSQGFATFETLQSSVPHIPIIVLTGLNDKDVALKAMQHGAQDYLIKGSVDGELLKRTMRYAIERKVAEEALRQRTAQLEALNDVALEITSQLELEKLLHSITFRAVELVKGSGGMLGLYHAEGDCIELSMYVGIEEVPEKQCFRRGEGLIGRVLERGTRMFVDDYARWPGRLPRWSSYLGHTAIMGIPIHWGKQILGVLEILGLSQTFNQAHAELLETFATQAAIAIRNARLQQNLREHAEKLEKTVADRTAELRTERGRLEAILQSITDGILVMRANGEIVHTNAVARTWLNQTLTLEDAEKLRATVNDLVQRAADEPETILELTGLDLEVQAAPTINSELKKDTAVVVIHDVTHLRAVSRMKSRFVSNISHELRTPLTTIKLYSQMMIQQPEKQNAYATLIEEEVNHQIELVEQILQISQLDAGRLEINPQPTALNDLTQTTVGNHRILAQNRDVTLAYQPCPKNPLAFIDARHVIVVFNNLLRNAIQYTNAGGEIRVSTGEQKMHNRSWATVTVEDTGIGIPEDELPRIFERFYRGERSRTFQISGNGLGLAIVKEIVELHGGRITVNSQVGQGSAFTVWLPQTRPEQGEQEFT